MRCGWIAGYRVRSNSIATPVCNLTWGTSKLVKKWGQQEDMMTGLISPSRISSCLIEQIQFQLLGIIIITGSRVRRIMVHRKWQRFTAPLGRHHTETTNLSAYFLPLK